MKEEEEKIVFIQIKKKMKGNIENTKSKFEDPHFNYLLLVCLCVTVCIRFVIYVETGLLFIRQIRSDFIRF